MRFTVTWHPSTIQELAQIWLDAADRDAVTQATNAIDRSLAHDPGDKGVDFYGDRLFVSIPLAVTFTVDDNDRVVQILQVWHE